DRATVEVITDIEDLRLEEVERNEDRQHLRDLAAQLSWALHRTLPFFSRGSLRCRPEIGIARRATTFSEAPAGGVGPEICRDAADDVLGRDAKAPASG